MLNAKLQKMPHYLYQKLNHSDWISCNKRQKIYKSKYNGFLTDFNL